MDVGEEVAVGKVVVGVRGVRDEEVGSRVKRSPKTLSPFSRTGLKRCGFGGLLSRRAVHAASRDEEDNSSSEMEPMAREGVVLVSDLPPFTFELHFRNNLFSFRVTFRIPVVRGKNLDIGSAHSRNPRRGVTRRAAEEERAGTTSVLKLQ